MKSKYTLFSDELEKKNIRPSHQRLIILEYFYQNSNHPTVDEIYKDLKSILPTITKATIYNTLKLFILKQIVIDVHIENNEVRYELLAKSHGHFKCTKCGTICDFAVKIDDINISGLDKFHIENKNLYFRGVCPKCLLR